MEKNVLFSEKENHQAICDTDMNLMLKKWIQDGGKPQISSFQDILYLLERTRLEKPKETVIGGWGHQLQLSKGWGQEG